MAYERLSSAVAAFADDRSRDRTGCHRPQEQHHTHTERRTPTRPASTCTSDVHKAIRVELFDLVAEAGRLDPDDRGARIAHAARVARPRRLPRLPRRARGHATSTPPSPRCCPSRPRHRRRARRPRGARWTDLIGARRPRVRRPTATPAPRCTSSTSSSPRSPPPTSPTRTSRSGSSCRRCRARSASSRCSRSTARSSARISPDDMGWSLSMMLPAMNIDDRAEMLGGMRAEAPPEVFAGVLGARRRRPPGARRGARRCARLEIEIARGVLAWVRRRCGGGQAVDDEEVLAAAGLDGRR